MISVCERDALWRSIHSTHPWCVAVWLVFETHPLYPGEALTGTEESVRHGKWSAGKVFDNFGCLQVGFCRTTSGIFSYRALSLGWRSFPRIIIRSPMKRKAKETCWEGFTLGPETGSVEWGTNDQVYIFWSIIIRMKSVSEEFWSKHPTSVK